MYALRNNSGTSARIWRLIFYQGNHSNHDSVTSAHVGFDVKYRLFLSDFN
jgi:hypothetical protein